LFGNGINRMLIFACSKHRCIDCSWRDCINCDPATA
jgi:hypothetical protein